MSNVTELLAQPEQKPVTNEPTKTAGAAIMPNGVCVSNVYDAYQEGRKSVMVEPLSEGEPLYTSPQKREALSDDEIWEGMKDEPPISCSGFIRGVRFAENYKRGE